MFIYHHPLRDEWTGEERGGVLGSKVRFVENGVCSVCVV